MATGRRSSIEAQIRTLWTAGAGGEADDATLIARFASGRDGAANEAFRTLLDRHGPMVLRTCRNVLGDRQDSEDAAQAVFLVLARKAASIRVAGTLAPWLHGVARRVAVKARGRTASRRQAEIRTATAAATLRARDGAGQDAPCAEDWQALHEEVDRLPEKYRTPVILCYLQGLTYEQAAAEIGCPVGTVRVRLSRARERLKGRLERRGYGPERVAGIAWLALEPGQVPITATAKAVGALLGGSSWAQSTVKAARALEMGRMAMAGTVSASVLGMYDSGVLIMLGYGWKTAAALSLAVGAIGAGAIVFGAAGPGAEEGEQPPRRRGERPRPQVTNPAREPADLLDPLKELRAQRERLVEAARRRLEAQRAYYEEGRITTDRYLDASRQLRIAETAASTTKEQRVSAAKAHLDRVDEILKRERAELDQGKGTVADVAETMQSKEQASLDYLEAKQSTGHIEIEALRTRVEDLEKQLESVKQELARIPIRGNSGGAGR